MKIWKTSSPTDESIKKCDFTWPVKGARGRQVAAPQTAKKTAQSNDELTNSGCEQTGEKTTNKQTNRLNDQPFSPCSKVTTTVQPFDSQK